MVSIYKIENKSKRNGNGYAVVELRGLSTDTKPTSLDGKYFDDGELSEVKYVDNGSVFIEIDTNDVYFFDLENNTWGDAPEPTTNDENDENNETSE